MVLAACTLRAATPVWIDTDPSVEAGGHEVDDGFALVQAFHSPELNIRGISAVFGNAPLEKAFPIAQEVARRFGPPHLMVYRGASSAAELGQPSDASRAIAAALRKERLAILAIGPVTNIATVLKLHPELRGRIARIIAVAGRRPGQEFRAANGAPPFRDFNFEMDPAAFQVILDSRVPLVLTGWEVASHVWLTGSDIAGIPYLEQPARDWLKVWKTRFGVDAFNPFDTLAVGYAIAPAGFRCEEVPVKIDGGQLLASKKLAAASHALYCSEPAADFKADLLRRIIIHSGA